MQVLLHVMPRFGSDKSTPIIQRRARDLRQADARNSKRLPTMTHPQLEFAACGVADRRDRDVRNRFVNSSTKTCMLLDAQQRCAPSHSIDRSRAASFRNHIRYCSTAFCCPVMSLPAISRVSFATDTPRHLAFVSTVVNASSPCFSRNSSGSRFPAGPRSESQSAASEQSPRERPCFACRVRIEQQHDAIREPSHDRHVRLG